MARVTGAIWNMTLPRTRAGGIVQEGGPWQSAPPEGGWSRAQEGDGACFSGFGGAARLEAKLVLGAHGLVERRDGEVREGVPGVPVRQLGEAAPRLPGLLHCRQHRPVDLPGHLPQHVQGAVHLRVSAPQLLGMRSAARRPFTRPISRLSFLEPCQGSR